MSIEQILSEMRTHDGLLQFAPALDSEHPEISWGDFFFHYAPDGQVPRGRQPYASIVTKDYPGDSGSRLDTEDRWRLSIHVGPQVFAELRGYLPGEIDGSGADLTGTEQVRPARTDR